MVSLRVGVRYYIQNVDSGSFLELPDKLAESEVKTRPVKVSEKQLWTIVADQQQSDVFFLENVAQKTWLGVVTDGNHFSQLVGHSRANACKWCLDPDLDGDGFWISFAGTKTPRCLELGEFGAILVAKRSTNDSQKWRFLTENEAYQLTLPKSNGGCLAAGHYRIRSMDGSVFISLSEPEPDSDSDAEHRAKCANPLAYTASKEEPVKSQKWLVVPSNDGTYSIQDTEQHLFLGCEEYDCYRYGPVHGLREAFGWDITPVGGGFAYTISVYSLSDLLSIGFRDYQAGVKELALMPAMSAHSQTWFFEPWDDSVKPQPSTKKGSKSKAGASSSRDHGPGATPRANTRPLPGSATSRFSAFNLAGLGSASQETVEDIGPPAESAGAPESDSENGEDGQPKLVPDGHYRIRNAGTGKYLNVATTVYTTSEPTHAPSRFFVRPGEYNDAQITPHSYVGQQSLIWRDSKFVVKDGQESAWQLIKDDNDVEDERRFQLKPVGAAPDYVLIDTMGSGMRIQLGEPDKERLYHKWDFETIY